MFEHFNYEILYMIKLFYDHTGIWYYVNLYDYEDGSNYELFQDMMYRIYGTIYQDIDDYGAMILNISDTLITHFFNLCKQYSRKKHQAFQKNPFVKELEQKIRSLYYSGSLVVDSGLPEIQLFIDEEDSFEYVHVLENLLLLKEFIEQKNKELETILCPTVGQSIAEHIERMAA